MKYISIFLLLLFCSFTEKKSLIVGTNAEFPPYCFIEEGKIVGFDIDIANAVAARLGKSVILKDMPFEALIPDVTLGKVDFVAAGLSYSEERAQRVNYTKPYMAGDPLVILTNEGSSKLTVDDLVGKKVAVNEGFIADHFLSKKEGVDCVRLPAIADGFMALKSKRVYAFVTAKTTYDSYLENGGMSFCSYPIEGTQETCALVVPKSKPELLEAIQKALDAMQEDGTLAAIKAKWAIP